MTRRSFRPVALSFLAAWLFSTVAAAQPRPVSFNRDIRPILSDNCFQCHGPDARTRKQDLRLDQRDSATADRGGYAAISPADPDESELVRRIFSNDRTERMPPPEARKTLNDRQKGLLRRWIAEGAIYEGHWAYQPIHRPDPPALSPADAADALNPIDAFILARLASEGVKPSPEADRRTLIRRLYFDLIGLPPTPEQIDAFLADPSPDAYEKVVDRLLTSPRFGERQAVAWLDAVRYADSVGFHGDQEVSVWPYRDYVSNAFNENLPFDTFTREQIAGDLLPDASRRARIASAFNRLNRMTAEGGAQDKEYLAKYAADRVRTVAMAWLGSTMGCAECHDHKFDPFTTRDFYSMQAFFADLKEHGFYPDGFSKGDWGPSLKLPTDEQTSALKGFDDQIVAVRAELAAITDAQLAESRAAWEQHTLELDSRKQLNWTVAKPLAAESSAGSTLTIHESGDVEASGHNPPNDTYTLTLKPGPGRWTALHLSNRVNEDYPGNRYARGWRSFVVTAIDIESVAGDQSRPIGVNSLAADDRGADDRFHPYAAVDGDPSTGWAYPHHHSFERWIILRFDQPLEADESTTLRITIRHDSPMTHATIARFGIKLTEVEGATHDDAALPEPVLEALRTPADQRTDEHRASLASHYRLVAPQLADLRLRELQLTGRRALLHGSIPSVLVSEATEPRPIRVLPRGNWMDDSGDIVQPAIPAFLGSLQTDGRATRLHLADWLVSPDNPLTARVIANRIWKQFFGAGLSRIAEDLGSQGDWPTHGDLLDYLAAEFIQPAHDGASAHPWDVKHLICLIVTSRAYRRSSLPRSDLTDRDPDNVLLARQNSTRFDAEIIRDNALALSGLLDDRLGGPSVFPIQPAGYWSQLNYPKIEYSPSTGSDLHRRTLYSHWQRTFVHPTLLAFDAPTREECQVSRPVSTTPLQALVLLNDPIFVETAVHFGSRAARSNAPDDTARIRLMFTQALGREPSSDEFAVLLDHFNAELARFAAAPSDAVAFLAAGSLEPADSARLAAFASLARAILNLSETITRY